MSDTDVRDPSDTTATWAIHPGEVRPLLARVRARHDGGTRTTTTPLTGAPLADLPLSTPQDVAEAVADAREAQRTWARTPLATRTALLRRVHDLVLDRQSEVLDLVQLETGKTRANAYEEIADVALVASHYARRAHRYLADRRATRSSRCSVASRCTAGPWASSASSRRGTTR